MSISVSHTHGGNVVILDLKTQARWEMSPDQAVDAALSVEQASQLGAHGGVAVVNCLDGRRMKYAGKAADLRLVAAVLREHAAYARAKVAA